MSHFNPNSLPKRWLKCPRKSEAIADRFIALKTPLDDRYLSQISPQYYFTPNMVLESLGARIGLWINLAFTDRFYEKSEIEKRGIRFVKISCRGHGETPNDEQTKCFIKICSEFVRSNPNKLIAVHCTHGFNRTGFLIASYLFEEEDWELSAAVAEFARKRPPGIYKRDYLEELFRRYGDINECPPAPELPEWCLEEEEEPDDADDDHSNGRPRKEFTKKDPVFMKGVSGATPIMDESELSRIRIKVQRMVGWSSGGFPGAQPVSMTRENLGLLSQKKYMVSWKADGTRYMLLIEDRKKIFFIDRDNSVFLISGLTFPDPNNHREEHLKDTLCDGEMVLDDDPSKPGKKTPRFLIYDIIVNGKNKIGNRDFETRFKAIKEQVIDGRNHAIQEGILNRAQEPFGVRRKDFFDLLATEKVLKMKTGHEHDGLIFQPVPDPYTGGQCNHILKWKPPDLNSIDFKCQISRVTAAGCLPETLALFYVSGNPPVMYAKKKLNRTTLNQYKEYDGKIVECTLNHGDWEVMRIRTDKSYANSYNTAQAVMKSIMEPVTERLVLDTISQICLKTGPQEKRKGMMPPPPLPVKHTAT